MADFVGEMHAAFDRDVVGGAAARAGKWRQQRVALGVEQRHEIGGEIDGAAAAARAAHEDQLALLGGVLQKVRLAGIVALVPGRGWHAGLGGYAVTKGGIRNGGAGNGSL